MRYNDILPHLRYNTDENFSLYYRDYIKLYNHTIKVAVTQEDPNRPFIMSSPSNGKQSDREGFVAKDPASELYGDSMSIKLFLISCLFCKYLE